jgi:hypothetical protein
MGIKATCHKFRNIGDTQLKIKKKNILGLGFGEGGGRFKDLQGQQSLLQF